MTRRIIFILTALLGLAGLVTVLASPASAQIPPFPDFTQLFASILNSLPAFIRGFVATLFETILQGFCVFFGNCAS
jgi:hypothetical protein